MTQAASSGSALEVAPTHGELIDRARALRPFLRERQAETEANAFPSEHVQQALLDAGFYRVLAPKRFGGYAVRPWTYLKLVMELARGCPSTAWCYALGHAHAFTVAAFFPPETQDEVFTSDDGYYCAASFGFPRGQATRADGGYIVSGTFPYGSGSPYANYYMGHTPAPGGSPHGPEGSLLFFIAKRADFRLADDWGDVLGLRGSGSHSVILENAFVPDHWVLPGSFAMLRAGPDGTHGTRYHEDSVYAIPQLPFATAYIPSVVTGAGWAALDEYERLQKSRSPQWIPGLEDTSADARFRSEVPEYQKNFGLATIQIEAAEALLKSAADELVEIGERGDHSDIEAMRLVTRYTLAGSLVWHAIQENLWRTSGTSSAANGARMQRYLRDVATWWTASGPAMRDIFATRYGRMLFEAGPSGSAAPHPGS